MVAGPTTPPAPPPTKFFVVDAAADDTFEYGAAGQSVSNNNLAAGNTNPRGVASTAAGDTVWVIDGSRVVYVYNADGALLGSWTAGGLTTPEGITTNGTDVWIVDDATNRVYRYANAAGRRSGGQSATSSFALAGGNANARDLVTDGASLWVVDNSTTDRVYKYTLGGSSQGSWAIDAANASPTGITLDPVNVNHLWIVDSGTDRVYQYDGAVSRTSGAQAASGSFALAAGNTNPQGIADPPAPGTVPTEVQGRFARLDMSRRAAEDRVVPAARVLGVPPEVVKATRGTVAGVPAVKHAAAGVIAERTKFSDRVSDFVGRLDRVLSAPNSADEFDVNARLKALMGSDD